MKRHLCPTLIFILLSIPLTVLAQEVVIPISQPRLSFGGQIGTFRVSYESFNEFYSSRWGFAWGGHASFRVTSSYSGVIKYRSFQKQQTVTVGSRRERLEWNERWLNLGLRFLRFPDQGIMSFVGFGLSLFSLEGNAVQHILPPTQDTQDGKVNPTGFFLDFGLGYPIYSRTYFVFEVELTSAGIEGSGGFEASSIGGLLLSTGIMLFPF